MKKYIILLFASLLILFTMSGCKQKSDSENAYRLPLGDAGYISEIDFDLYRVEVIRDDNGEVFRCYDGFGCYTLDEYDKALNDAQIQEDRIIY